MPMTVLTIQASKNGEFVEAPRSDSMIAVTQARMLLEAGWQVHIADAAGRQFQPSELRPWVGCSPSSPRFALAVLFFGKVRSAFGQPGRMAFRRHTNAKTSREKSALAGKTKIGCFINAEALNYRTAGEIGISTPVFGFLPI